MKPHLWLVLFSSFVLSQPTLAQPANSLRELPLAKAIAVSLPLRSGGQQVRLSYAKGEPRLRVQVGNQSQTLKIGILEGQAQTDLRGDILAGDLNFDGWLDLALPESDGYGGVVYYYAIFVYSPNLGRFVELTFPGDNSPYLADPQPDATTRTLETAYKSGPAWYQNHFRFAAGKPYLYQKASMILVGEVVEEDILWLEQTFDPNGKLRSSRITEDTDKPPVRTLKLERLEFYTQPSEASRTSAYIVKGDRFEVLEVLKQGEVSWVKIAYQSRTAGRMVRWVKLPVEMP
jgi:hypothetical protein